MSILKQAPGKIISVFLVCFEFKICYTGGSKYSSKNLSKIKTTLSQEFI